MALAGLCLTAQTPAMDPFLGWLNGIAQQQLAQRDREIAAIRTPADAARRRAAVREKLMEILGGLPKYDGPLRARVTGQIRNEFFTIEKVIFDSLPGFYITGNVYRPNAPGRYPGVLVPAGHTQEGKPEQQVLAANLARKGFVVLTYDPIGQGEREQTYLPQIGRALSGGGGNEHLELGARSLVIGQSMARYFIHDAKRAVDYLVSRADVDADRLGVTGCSGGGAITSYVAAFDPRMKAAAAGCFINTFKTLFTGPTPDSEMTMPRFLANGLDLADIFEQAAPLPWLLMATEEDYFVPAGARPVYEEARQWYEILGAQEKIRYFVGTGPHGTPLESREEVYRWLTRWLKDGMGEVQDQPVPMYTSRELFATSGGNVDFEPGSRKVWQVIQEEYRAKKAPKGMAALLAELRRLGVPSSGPAPAVRVVESTPAKGYRVDTVRFAGEPGVEIGGRIYVPDGGGRKPAVVMIEERRLRVPLYVQLSQSTAASAEAMVKAGWVVLELYPRDMPDAVDGRPWLGNWVTNERVDLIGRNLAAMRAHDVLVGVDVLTARPDVDAGTIRGYARGAKGFWMLMAAAMDKRIGALWLERTPWSYGAALDAPLAGFLFEAMIPGFALHWDMSDLREAMGPRPVLWTDPANWMNQVVDAGPKYRYRYVGEKDDVYLNEFLKR